MPRILLALLVLIAGCTTSYDGNDARENRSVPEGRDIHDARVPRIPWPAKIAFPGGQVRSRADGLDGQSSLPIASAGFATPAAIDGDLSDPAWTGVRWQGDAPAFAACCDQANLYLAARTPIVHADLQAAGPGEVRDGPIERADLICFRLAPQDRQEMFVDLMVAPDATVSDRQMSWTPEAVSRYYGGFNLAGLRTASRIVQGRWTLEVAIPWSALWTSAPRPGQGASMRLQVAGRAGGAAAWKGWAPSAGYLDEPPSRFGVLVLGDVAPPWRAVHGDLIAGAGGRMLALALVRGGDAPAEAMVVVNGAVSGRSMVRLNRSEGRVLVPLQLTEPAPRPDAFREFGVQVEIAGKTWPLGSWNLRDPIASAAGALVVPGVGGEAADLPVAASGLSLASLAIPQGRTAIDLGVRSLADGTGPWRLRVIDAGSQLIELDIPRCPAIAAIPTASLPPGTHRLSATLVDTMGRAVLSAVLPLDVIP